MDFKASSSIPLFWQFTDVTTEAQQRQYLAQSWVPKPSLLPPSWKLYLWLCDLPPGILPPSDAGSHAVSLLRPWPSQWHHPGLGRAIEECNVGGLAHCYPPYPCRGGRQESSRPEDGGGLGPGSEGQHSDGQSGVVWGRGVQRGRATLPTHPKSAAALTPLRLPSHPRPVVALLR